MAAFRTVVGEVHDVALRDISGDVDGLPVAWTQPHEVIMAGFGA